MGGIDIAKASLIRDMYVRTADENYITARWCISKKFDRGFWWESNQSVEKYLKGILLLNGMSALGLSHDTVGAFKKVAEIASPLITIDSIIPIVTKPTENVQIRVIDFIEKCSRQGSPDSRYFIELSDTSIYDLHCLDWIVFNLRRMQCNLTIKKIDADGEAINIKDYLNENKKYMPNFNFPYDTASKKTSELYSEISFENLFIEDNENISGNSFKRFQVNVILDLISHKDFGYVDYVASFAEWIIKNIKVPKNIREKLEKVSNKRLNRTL